MSALRISPGVEHYCSLRPSALCTGPTSGKPKRKACPRCKGAFIVREGTYAVVPWRGDGRYSLDQAIATRSTRERAFQLALKSGPQYVERFLPLPTEES